jgi:hypothetical protein
MGVIFMSIDIHTEQLLSLKEAARSLPKIDGKTPHASSIYRWCIRGISGVKLDHVRLGRRVVTSKEALNRFVNELAQKDAENLQKSIQTFDIQIVQPNNQSKHRRSQIESAERILHEKGL